MTATAAQRRFDTEQRISRRAYGERCISSAWEEIWEAANYYDRLSELLENAQKSVVIVGWQIDSRLPLKIPGTDRYESLKEKLIRLCDSKRELQIYILMWDHAWFYIYEREIWQGRIWEDIHPRVHFIFDNRHPLGASHHEKLVLLDGHIALCGGIDLCDDRWDTPRHLFSDRRRSLTLHEEKHGPYHDLGVQVSGPICVPLHRHIAERWNLLSTIPFPPEPTFHTDVVGRTVYLSRTLARIDLERGQPHVLREIEFLYRDLVLKAEKRLILEGQYYWSEEFNDLLIRKMMEMRGKDFEMILVLADLRHVKSLTRVMTQYELSLLDRLTVAAKCFGTRLHLTMPYSYDFESATSNRKALRPRPIYVHSKVLVVDDRYLSIGSANFAERALRLDSEVTLTFEASTEAERRHIQSFSENLLEHWNTDIVQLRAINPGMLLHHQRGADRWFEPPAPYYTWISWKRWFDPRISPFYPLKLWLSRARFNKNRGLRWACKALLTVGAAILVQLLSSDSWHPGLSELSTRGLIYSFLLCSVWAAPVPFLLIALIATVDGKWDVPSYGIRLSVASLECASLLGYFATRMFPTRAIARYQSAASKTASHWYRRFSLQLTRRLGERLFPKMLAAAFDPGVPLHYKIAFEGVYSMPLAWFALVNGVLLPAVLAGILWVWKWLWVALAA